MTTRSIRYIATRTLSDAVLGRVIRMPGCEMTLPASEAETEVASGKAVYIDGAVEVEMSGVFIHEGNVSLDMSEGSGEADVSSETDDAETPKRSRRRRG